MGLGGELVLKFDNLILNKPGDDLEIIETSFGNPSCAQYPEKATISVSQDGSTWDELGDICQDATLDLDDGDLDFEWAKFVKIQDITDPDDFGSGNVDGYDVDGVRAINCGTIPDLTGESCDGSWNLANLDNQKFFNFNDIKPGDSGKNIISLHVEDNNAWACLTIDNLENDDNGCVEPEALVDSTCGDGEGELAENLDFFAWADDGDSFFEPDQGEIPLFTNIIGPASDVLDDITYPIADSDINVFTLESDDPLTGLETNYIGLIWCAGDMTLDENTGNLNCDASGMGNDSQSDSLSADITFIVEQARNNSNFTCNE